MAKELVGTNESDDVYTGRRFDTVSHKFGAPVRISNPSVETDVIFRDIFQDPGGNIAAVFIANGVYGGGKHEDPMRYRASIDGGKTWGPEKTLIDTSDAGFNLQMGAAADGGGFVAYDDNSDPPLKAVAIPTLSNSGAGGGGGTGGLPARARCRSARCRRSPPRLPAKQKNGTTDQRPGAAQRPDPCRTERPASGRRRRRRRSRSTLLPRRPTSTPQTCRLVRWCSTGQLRLNVGSGSLSNVTTFAHPEVRRPHLRVPGHGRGIAAVRRQGRVHPAHLGCRRLRGVTADVTLRLKNPGGLEGFAIHVGEAFLGVLKIKPLTRTTRAAGVRGLGDVPLPPAYSDPGVHVAFGFVNGKFKHAELDPVRPAAGDPALGLPAPDRAVAGRLAAADRWRWS
jgi:hypothetical protein